MATAGISQETRALLERLHRRLPGPFGAAEAAAVLALPRRRAARLLQDLQAGGWLVRMRPGTYATVPLGSERPQDWRVDPWVVATALWSPCYVAGWTALSHWELTEQLFQVTVVVSARRLRGAEQVVQGALYLVRRLPVEKHFGQRAVWRDGTKTQVSDPARTLVDVLSDPSLGGGIRHVAECLSAWLESDHRADELLLDYARRFGNRAVFKRLGFLVEALDLPAPVLVERCLEEQSAGLSPLDPSVAAKGTITKRWNLRVNARL